jgi:hypothetical protein
MVLAFQRRAGPPCLWRLKGYLEVRVVASLRLSLFNHPGTQYFACRVIDVTRGPRFHVERGMVDKYAGFARNPSSGTVGHIEVSVR